MRTLSLLLAFLLGTGLSLAQAPAQTAAPATPKAKVVNRIDDFVFGRLAELHLEAAEPVSDAVFLRRVYLDVIGTLPKAAEARDFFASKDPEKRRALVERLLRREEYADYWAMKWCDILRVKAEFPINLWPNAAQAYHHWLRAAVHENMPYDKFARSLLCSNGSNFRDAPVNFYRAVQGKDPKSLGRAAALAFLGMRAEKWSEEQLTGFSVFFSCISYKATGEWKEEIVAFDPSKKPLNSGKAWLPDGSSLQLDGSRDPREVFAGWLLKPENPWFAKVMANRVWYWLMGRGLVQEPDDFRADNEASNPQLLDYLAAEFRASHYNVKHLFRLILNSRAYQLSSEHKRPGEQVEVNFAAYPLRRLDAEVLIDAINQITGSTEQYTSAIPEPYTYIPENERAIALPDGSISSPFLELFGRPARDTGLEAERNNRLTPMQRLHLLNSSHIRRKLEQGPRVFELLRSSKTPVGTIENIYLTVLSRYPTAEELKTVSDHFSGGQGKGREAAIDLLWTLINSNEFLHRH